MIVRIGKIEHSQQYSCCFAGQLIIADRDDLAFRPLKIYVHFTDFRIKQLKNIVNNPIVGQTPIYYIYRFVDLVFNENGKIIKDRYPPII